MTPADRDGFLVFLRALASGASSEAEWAHFVVAHHADRLLEEARAELVRASIAAGDWSWEHLPDTLRVTARELHARLCLRGD